MGNLVVSSSSSPAPPPTPHLLKCNADTYGGIVVEAEGDVQRASFSTAVEFEASLVHSLATWKEEKKRGVWLKLSKAEVALGFAATALAHGFQMHSVVEESLLLTSFLSDVGSHSSLPKAASHYLGVGVVCINDAKEILVVQERTGPTAGMGFWKMPTGQVDTGEDLGTAAIRELKEETGIDADFDSILTFRHMHHYMFSKGDLFFVCLMKLPAQNQTLVVQETEIAAARWMPIHEYASQPFFSKSPLHQKINEVVIAASSSQTAGRFKMDLLPSGYRGDQALYYHTFDY